MTVTIKGRFARFFGKPKPTDFGPPAMEENFKLAQSAPQEPYRPPHPCESRGHEYAPLNKSAREILLACVRCADVQRIPLKLAAPPPPQRRYQTV